MKASNKKLAAVIMVFSMLLSMIGVEPFGRTAQADDVFQEVPVMNITRPSEVEDLIAEDKGLAFQMTGNEAKQKFTVNERGWLIVKCYFGGGGWHDYSASVFYANSSLSKRLGDRIGGHNGQSGQANYYIDAGTYYISHDEGDKENSKQSVFLYFLPESSIAQSRVESTASGTKISVSFTPDRASAKILNDKYSVDKINADVWKNATIMVDNSYTTTSAGDFTIKGEFSGEEWKNYPVLLNVTVDKANAGAPEATKKPETSKEPAATAAPSESNAPADNADTTVLTKINLKDESLTMVVGEDKKTAFSTEPKEVKAEELDWFSSDEEVAEIDDSGRITAVGSGTAKITAQTKDGKVSAVLKLVVKPQIVDVTSIKSTKKKITLKWEKSGNVSGYQVSYALKSNFSGAKSKNLAARSSTVTLNNLKSRKYYYLRIRSYQNVDGKKYYSDWSNAGKIKVK